MGRRSEGGIAAGLRSRNDGWSTMTVTIHPRHEGNDGAIRGASSPASSIQSQSVGTKPPLRLGKTKKAGWLSQSGSGWSSQWRLEALCMAVMTPRRHRHQPSMATLTSNQSGSGNPQRTRTCSATHRRPERHGFAPRTSLYTRPDPAFGSRLRRLARPLDAPFLTRGQCLSLVDGDQVRDPADGNSGQARGVAVRRQLEPPATMAVAATEPGLRCRRRGALRRY